LAANPVADIGVLVVDIEWWKSQAPITNLITTHADRDSREKMFWYCDKDIECGLVESLLSISAPSLNHCVALQRTGTLIVNLE
jgi:hypothetical protein